MARVWTSAEYIRARFVRFLMLRPVLALAVRDGRERGSGLVLPPLRQVLHPPRGGKLPSLSETRTPESRRRGKAKALGRGVLDFFFTLHDREVETFSQLRTFFLTRSPRSIFPWSFLSAMWTCGQKWRSDTPGLRPLASRGGRHSKDMSHSRGGV